MDDRTRQKSEAAARARQAQEIRRKRSQGGDGGASGEGSGSDSGSSGAAAPKSGSSRPLKIAAAIAVAAVIGVGAIFGLGGGGDSISDQESLQRQTAYETLVSSGGMELDMVSAEEMDQAIESMPLEPEAKEQVREQVNSGQTRLAWLTLRDTHAEDGDILRFESESSVPVEVMALNAPTTLAIPYPPSGHVKVTGVVDGGGGITIELMSGATQIAWPTMRPGDTLDLPVTPGF